MMRVCDNIVTINPQINNRMNPRVVPHQTLKRFHRRHRTSRGRYYNIRNDLGIMWRTEVEAGSKFWAYAFSQQTPSDILCIPNRRVGRPRAFVGYDMENPLRKFQVSSYMRRPPKFARYIRGTSYYKRWSFMLTP